MCRALLALPLSNGVSYCQTQASCPSAAMHRRWIHAERMDVHLHLPCISIGGRGVRILPKLLPVLAVWNWRADWLVLLKWLQLA